MADVVRRVYEIDAKISSDALSALRAVQQGMKAVEDTAKAAQKSLDGLSETTSKGLDAGGRFIKNLKDQIATLGLGTEATLRYQAAQLGVSDTADGLISSLTKKQALLKADADALQRAARAEADAVAAIKAHEAAGASLVSGLAQQIAAFGKEGDALIRYKAGLLGVAEPVDRLLIKLNELKAAQKSIADEADRSAKKAADEAAAKEKVAESTDRLVASLKREIDTFGQDTLAIKQYDAALLGASKDVDPLIAKLRDLQAVEEKEAKAAKDAAKTQDDIAAALRRRKNASDNFLASLKDEVATSGKSRSEIAQYRAAQLGLTAEAAPLIAQLKATEKGAHGAASGFDKINFSSVGARRELLVLAHELSQGNYKQFGGSLLVLGERVDATSLIMSKAGLSAIGLAGAVAGVIAVLAAGAHEQDLFNKALFLTNNASGQTAGSLELMARRVKEASGATIGQTKEILTTLVETGRYGPKALESVGAAAANLQRVTGQAGAEVAKEFEGITKSVSQWADKANEKYHFLSAAQLAYIRDLENQKKSEEALIFGTSALANSLDKQRQNVGILARTWKELTSAISDAKDRALEYGKTDTAGAEIVRLKKEIDEARDRRDGVTKDLTVNDQGKKLLPGSGFVRGLGQTIGRAVTAPFERDPDVEIAEKEARIAALKSQAIADSANAKLDAVRARSEEEKNKALKDLDEIRKSVRAGGEAVKELEAYDASIKKIKAGGIGSYVDTSDKELIKKGFFDLNGKKVPVIPDDRTQAEDRRLIQQKYGTKAENELANAIKATRAALGEERTAIEDQIAEYDAYGKSVDKSREAKIRFELAQGKLKGAPAGVQQEFIDQARKIDQDTDINRQQKAQKATKEIVDGLKEVAEARAVNARETEIANKIAQIERTELSKSSDAYRQAVADITKYVNAKHDVALVRQLKEDVAQTEYESKRLAEETALIGKNSIERKQAVAILKLEEEARKRLKDNPESADIINAAKRVQIDEITTALQKNYDEQRRFEAGAKQMFAKYAEDAQDGASFAERAIGGGLKSFEDAIVEFTHTGKLSFTSLFQFMADEFTRQAVRINVAKLFDTKGEGGGDLFSKVGTFLGDLFGTKKNGSVVDSGGLGIGSIGVSQQTPQQIESYVQDAAAATSKAAETTATQLVTASMIELAAVGVTPVSFAMELAAEAAYSLATALELASSAASSGSSSGGGGIFGMIGSLFSGSGLSAGSASASGGQIDFSGGGGLGYAASGGVMSPFGLLPLQHYSRGGIADRAQLAIFGEGRKREAYIPMEDNKNVRVSVKSENGQLKAYAPLSGGRGIPVLLDGLDRLDPAGAYMRLPNGKRLAAFAGGGIMSGYGPEDLPIRGYAEGGEAGGTYPLSNALAGSQPYVPDRGVASSGVRSGDTYIHVEDKVGVQVTPRETTKPNGDKEIRFIIEQAVNEVDRRIAGGGSTGQLLKSRGLSTTKALPIRG